MNTDKSIDWPVVYLDLLIDEELMLVTFADWTFDVDTHFTIGPIAESEQHFFIDLSAQVFPLAGGGIDKDRPEIVIGDSLSYALSIPILKEAQRRAKRWSGLEEKEIRKIIRALEE